MLLGRATNTLFSKERKQFNKMSQTAFAWLLPAFQKACEKEQ